MQFDFEIYRLHAADINALLKAELAVTLSHRHNILAGVAVVSRTQGLLFAAALDPPVQEFPNRRDVERDLLGSRRRMWFEFGHRTLAAVWRQDDRDGYRVRVGFQRAMHATRIFAGPQDVETEGQQPAIDVECE
jgi:hypothetical protein